MCNKHLVQSHRRLIAKPVFPSEIKTSLENNGTTPMATLDVSKTKGVFRKTCGQVSKTSKSAS